MHRYKSNFFFQDTIVPAPPLLWRHFQLINIYRDAKTKAAKVGDEGEASVQVHPPCPPLSLKQSEWNKGRHKRKLALGEKEQAKLQEPIGKFHRLHRV